MSPWPWASGALQGIPPRADGQTGCASWSGGGRSWEGAREKEQKPQQTLGVGRGLARPPLLQPSRKTLGLMMGGDLQGDSQGGE